MNGEWNLVLVAYMAIVTLAVGVGASLNQLLSGRSTTARYAVSFSAGVMLAVCLLYLIPDALAFEHGILRPRAGGTDHVSVGYALSIGFFSLLTIERYLLRAHHHGHDHGHGPDDGHDHDHDDEGRGGARGHDCAHDHEPPHHHQHDRLQEARELQVAWSTVVALSLHSLFDGVALYAAGVMPAMGPALATAIVLHKVPESATLLAVLRRGGVAQRRRLLVLGLYAAATPLGMLMAAQLLHLLSERGVALLMAFVAGSLLHLVTGHLLPEATEHNGGPRGAYGVVLIGFAMLLLARLLGAG